MTTIKNIFRQLFAFFSSLQLAIFVLLTLAAVLAAGTVVESLRDTETAGHYIYHTPWFAALLGLLGLNVFCAGLSRYPWKRHHTGFLVVHLGILIILAGSFITLYAGFEGQLIIPEGESRERIFLSESSLYFYDRDQGKLEELEAHYRFYPPTQKNPQGGKVLQDVLVKVNEYLPHALLEEEIQEGADEVNPALQVQLKGQRASLSEWVFAREYARQSLDLGPARVSFVELSQGKDLEKILADKTLRGPVLWVDGQWIPLRGNLNKEFKVGKDSLLIKNFYPQGAVYQGQLVNLSDEPNNPVVLLSFKQANSTKDIHLFSKFPELNHGAPGEEGSVPSMRLIWIPEVLGKKDNEMVLVKADVGDAYFALKAGGKWGRVQPLAIGKDQATGWMDFNFKVSETRSRAKVVRKFRRAVVPTGKEGPPPAVHLQIARAGIIKDLWLGRGQAEDISLGEKNLKLAYALKSLPLGFSVKLKEFRMGKYDGTENPSSYESLVQVQDKTPAESGEHLIAMNEPLHQGKYKIFQASYQLNQDGPDWSVLAVAYDPGINIKYLGSLILVLGIVIIFYFRKAYMGIPIGERIREKLKAPSYSNPGLVEEAR